MVPPPPPPPPPLDRSALSRYEDEAVESKLLRASVTASVLLGEHIRRLEQTRAHKAEDDEALKKLVATNTEAIRKMATLEETLRREREAMSKELEKAKAEGKAEAEAAAVAAAKEAAEAAEKSKSEAVTQAVANFIAGGWRAEDQKAWRVS
ncbi:unnamed protein product, partial [Cuscuta epithymum]